jgi:hypothetical protein
MNFNIGPFNLLYLIIFILLSNIIGLFLILKRRLGIEAIIILLFFPIIGFISIILYDLSLKKK